MEEGGSLCASGIVSEPLDNRLAPSPSLFRKQMACVVADMSELQGTIVCPYELSTLCHDPVCIVVYDS